MARTISRLTSATTDGWTLALWGASCLATGAWLLVLDRYWLDGALACVLAAMD